MHSGMFNGKNISKIDNTVISVKFEMEKENLSLIINRKNGQHLKVLMDIKKLAFIIMERVNTRIEITLSSSPYCESFIEGSWKEVKNSIFNSGLSFHCILSNLSELEKINSFIKESNILTQFQDYCFCYKPNEKNVTKTVSKSTSTNKISILRHKMTSLNIKEPTVQKEEKIFKDVLNNFCK